MECHSEGGLTTEESRERNCTHWILRLRFRMTCFLIFTAMLVSSPAYSAEKVALDETRTEILRLAARAPSGHNTQPWLVKFEDQDHFAISVRSDSLLPAVDPNHRETLISIGAFLENLVLAAGKYGYKVEYKVVAKDARDENVVKVTLIGSPSTGYDTSALEERRTLRKGFKSDIISKDDIEQITSHAPGSFVYHPRGGVEANAISSLTLQAFTMQAMRDDAEEELSRWIHWSRKEANAKKDGLTIESMELRGFSAWFARTFFTPETVMKKGFRKKSISLAKKQVESGGGWLILTSDDTSPSSLIETGRILEAMLLKVRSRNIAIQPMSQVLEEAGFKESLVAALGIKKDIQMILRVGYIEKYPKSVSFRRNVNDFVR